MPLEVDLGRPVDYYLCVPLQGRARFRILDRATIVGVGEALFVSPAAYLRGYVDEHSERLLVQLDRTAVEDILGRTDASTNRFMPSRFLDLRADAAKPLAQLLDRFARRLSVATEPATDVAAACDVTDAFEQLVAALRPLIDPLANEVASGASRSEMLVCAIEAYMRQHCSEGVALDDVTRAFGLSHRSLQLAFRSTRPYAPLTYLRRIQLESARIELCRRDAEATSVTEIATEHGFSHFGRFSKNYRVSFGESPSATIRRRRLEINRYR